MMKKSILNLALPLAMIAMTACGNAKSDGASTNDQATDSVAVEAVDTVAAVEEAAAPAPDPNVLTADDEAAVLELITKIHTQEDNKKYTTGKLRDKLKKPYTSIGLYDYGTDGMVEWSIVPGSIKITSFDPATGKVKYQLTVKCYDNGEEVSWTDVQKETATVVREDGKLLLSDSSTYYTWS